LVYYITLEKNLYIYISPKPHGATAARGPGLSHTRDFKRSHTETPHAVDLLWTTDNLDTETSI